MSTPFDPLAAAARLRAENARYRGKRLTYSDHFQAFALLKSGVYQEVVAKIFGLSASSISHLANCLTRKPGVIVRYPHVFNEWRLLQEEGFLRAYLTEERVMQADRIKRDAAELLDVAPLGASNERADSCAYKVRGAFQVGDVGWYRIDWVEGPAEIAEPQRGPIGWRYVKIDEKDNPAGPYMGISPYDEPERPDGMWMPWRTSGDAFDAVHTLFDIKSPRRPGRPRK